MAGKAGEAGRKIDDSDFYLEGDRVVFTSSYHLRRGVCCGSGCRHCPFLPRRTKDATTPAPELSGSVAPEKTDPD